MQPLKILLVDDSPTFVAAISAALEKDVSLKIVGIAANGKEALAALENTTPDVIVSDVVMPVMDGIDFLKVLMPKKPLPVVVISGTAELALTALQSGAVDFIAKPKSRRERDTFLNQLILKIKIAALSNMRAKLAAPISQANGVLKPTAPLDDKIIAIGASTGGTDAILEIVRTFPADFPPVLIVQHMPAGFTAMYAQRLNNECLMQVSEARNGQRVTKGQAIVAAGGYHMRLQKDAGGYFVTSKKGDAVSGHIPSVDVLFQSVAGAAKDKAVGVILTGMGADGAKGLLKMRKAGAYTLGQDKESSVVYGMPMAAYNNGAVQKQLPLANVAADIVRHLQK